jgi:hypothetical protein
MVKKCIFLRVGNYTSRQELWRMEEYLIFDQFLEQRNQKQEDTSMNFG